MRALALLCVWSLAGCSSVSGPLDWVLPDEVSVGQGTQALGGSFSDGVHDFALDGEQDSTYAALTWKIPGVERSDGMTRETQRNMALLIDKMVDDEIGATDSQGDPISPLSKVKLPPTALLVGVGLVMVFLVLAAMKKSRRSSWR